MTNSSPSQHLFAEVLARVHAVCTALAGDGVLPGQAGYGLMAWLVLHTGWHGWLGLPDDAV